MTGARVRRTARVFLFDERGDVMMIRFVAERDGSPFVFWVTPGGEVEPGEDDVSAAKRELQEELGLVIALEGPVHEETGGTYTHLNETVRSHDVFFTGLCARDEPKLAGATVDERRLMREARWWTLEELRVTQEEVFPANIADIPAIRRTKQALGIPSCGFG